MSDIKDYFGGGGAEGLFPTFPPKRPLVSKNSGHPEGFLGDGDTLQLPQAPDATGTVVYRDNTNAIQWTLATTDVHANVTAFTTFMLDSVDNLLWVLSQDDINDVLYLTTINAAGTIVNVGNAATATDLSDTTHGWIAVLTNRSGGNMLRAVEGTGNFTCRLLDVEFVIDYTDGSIVTETTKTHYVAGSFESTSGVLFNPASIAPASTASNIDGMRQQFILRKPTSYDADNHAQVTLYPSLSLGLPSNQNTNAGVGDRYSALQWKDDVLLVNPGTTMGDLVLFDKTLYLKAVNALVTNFNIDQ